MPDHSLHVANMKDVFLSLRKHNLKLSPSKATIGATAQIYSVTPSLPPASCQTQKKVESLTKMLMPTDLEQLRSLLGGLSYYRNVLRDMANKLLAELSAPPVLVYPNWDAVSDTSRPFLL